MSQLQDGVEGKNSKFDLLAVPTLNERARQQFVSQLRKHIMVDMAGVMRDVYSNEVEPAVAKSTGRAPRDPV